MPKFFLCPLSDGEERWCEGGENFWQQLSFDQRLFSAAAGLSLKPSPKSPFAKGLPRQPCRISSLGVQNRLCQAGKCRYEAWRWTDFMAGVEQMDKFQGVGHGLARGVVVEDDVGLSRAFSISSRVRAAKSSSSSGEYR